MKIWTPSNPVDARGARIVWSPTWGSQMNFVTCPVPEVLFEGQRGNGKTDGLLMAFASQVGKGFGPNWRGIIFRETYKQLADLVAKSHKWYRPVFRAKFNASDFVWKFPTGEQLLFRYMAKETDYWEYHGHEYPFIGWEELVSWANGSCYLTMMSCWRSSFPGMPRMYRATTNPYGVGHAWVKRRWIKPNNTLTVPPCSLIREPGFHTRTYIKGKLNENKHLIAADPEYVQKLKSIKDPVKLKAWIDGSWEIVAGAMFGDLWNESRHVIRPFKIPPSWKIDRGFDWGSSKPFAMLWFATSDGTDAILPGGVRKSFPPGTIFVIAEWYGWNGTENEGSKMLAFNIAKEGLEIEAKVFPNRRPDPGPADSAIYDVENGKSIAADMALGGMTWTRADKGPGSRITGAELVRTYLYHANCHPQEDPGIFFFDTCIHTIRTLPGLPRDEKKPDDVNSDAEDHCYDVIRYKLQSSKGGVLVTKTQGA